MAIEGSMAPRFVWIDHDTPMLLPPDLRAWVPEDHLVHFIMEAVGLLDVGGARVNQRGSGSEQSPPGMMLGLLIYCYATGTFSRRRIERLTHENVAVRLLCADTHPDHDSICTFRVKNGALLKDSFHQVLEAAARIKVLRVGDVTLAIDGTKILANASRHSAVSHDHAVKQMLLLEEQIDRLLAKAADADSTPLEDGLTIGGEVARRRDRIGQLRGAVAVIQARAKERPSEQLAEFEAKQQAREEKQRRTGKKPGGRAPKAPGEAPQSGDQYNFTDPESRIMKTGGGFGQSYNAQAALEIQSRLIVGEGVTDAPNDKQQLHPTLGTVSPVIETVGAVLIDSGFFSAAAVAQAERKQAGAGAPKIYAATGRHPHGRSVGQLEKRTDPPEPAPGAGAREIMEWRLATKAGRELYGQRKETIEPVFGIIKAAMGFRRFSLRGMGKVRTAWTLVTLACNLKHLFHLGAKLVSA